MNNKYTCPCCGYKTLSEKSGDYDICEICFWEDDAQQLANPNLEGCANKLSLRQAQQNFINYGYSDKSIAKHVRKPNSKDIKDSGWKLL